MNDEQPNRQCPACGHLYNERDTEQLIFDIVTSGQATPEEVERALVLRQGNRIQGWVRNLPRLLAPAD